MENPIAFPTLTYNTITGNPDGQELGMTLLDYFAGKAIQGLMSNLNDDMTETELGHIPEAAYVIAEAMLKEREKYIK